MNVLVVIHINPEQQAEELFGYYRGIGAKVPEYNPKNGLENDLHQIIDVCDTCFTKATSVEVEGILNGIVSMFTSVAPDRFESLITSFCEKLSKPPTNEMGLVCLKVLWSLLMSLEDSCSFRFMVYYFLVGVAGRAHQLQTVYKDMPTTRSMFTKCPPTNEQMQKLLRLLHEVLLINGKSEEAGRVMIELLGTYTTENANQAREEAQRCIVASLADPNTFLLDHLLQLKPVKFLEGEPIHNLLIIFVSEQLDAYIAFYEKNKDFVTSLGLKHEDNIRKMRMLSFMQMAENRNEITFQEVKTALQLKDEEIEEFLIDVIKTKLVRAKISQGEGVIHVSSTMHRTFGLSDWQQLHTLLHAWKANLTTVKDQLSYVVATQTELMHKKI